MPGDETKNYDFVIEVNEQGCDKIIGAFFNKSFDRAAQPQRRLRKSTPDKSPVRRE